MFPAAPHHNLIPGAVDSQSAADCFHPQRALRRTRGGVTPSTLAVAIIFPRWTRYSLPRNRCSNRIAATGM